MRFSSGQRFSSVRSVVAALKGHRWIESDFSIREALHRYPALIFTVVAVLGILLDWATFRSLNTSLLIWGGIATASWLTSEIVGPRQARPVRLSAVTSGLAVLCLFACWHAFLEHRYRSATIGRLLQSEAIPVIVRGKLAERVTLRLSHHTRDAIATYNSELVVRVDSFRQHDRWSPCDGKVLVTTEGDHSGRLPGERLEVYGWLRAFDAPTNPGEPDLRIAYRRRGLHARMETKNADAIVRLQASTDWVHRSVASIANSGRESLLRHTDRETGSLALALILGQRELVDAEMRDALLTTGTAHLLSVSGMHLAILVLFVSWAIAGAGLRPISRLIVIVSLSAIYVAMTGGRPPVLRAAILIGVLMLAACFRRTSQPLNTLAFAAVLLLLKNPLNLFSTGVHLSFLAVVTLMLAGRSIASVGLDRQLDRQRQQNSQEQNFQQLVDEASPRWRRFGGVVFRFVFQMAWMSACVTAVSLPYVWSQFHLISLVSVLTNVLVWSGLMIALPAGVLVVIFEPIAPWLSELPGAGCQFALRYMSTVIRWSASIENGHVWLPSPNGFSVGSFYVVLMFTLVLKGPIARWVRLGWIAVWILVNVWLVTQVAPLPPTVLEATFVDVGHGTSVIVRSYDQTLQREGIWLYDCGRLGNQQMTSRPIDRALWSMGITSIDEVYLSHADSDHFNALPALLDRFAIGKIITPPRMLMGDGDLLARLRTAIDNAGVPVVEVHSDRRDPRWTLPGNVSVLHPPASRIEGNDNVNSLVLSIQHADTTLLLPGDLEPPGTQVLVNHPRPRPGGVMMAPHHGSLRMNADMVLAWARPGETIVSGGQRAGRPEVHDMLSQTGSGVYVTAQKGAIRVRLDQDGKTEIRSWLERPW
ncbi:ComEC/Rec2 family competence protein [Roseiconus lacunae]|uniref:ComEC/Rec2 family competence protein n=1 Tax=Roseiconus lacunae TaxID=2605694 RepID=UPI001E2E2DBB|nr:ComEC/Rec2 family competence protein [Roseiconus lacunae]MCD0463112.1 ComEC/Rec2 family competence protein [Roseiconus lacunae]